VTEPWGFDSSHAFLNAVCCIETTLSPYEILWVTQDIERMVGRTKKTVNGCYSDRLIDIDILIYDDCRLNTPELTIPHPLMHKRDFVMKPLEEIAPDLVKSMFADWVAEHSSLADR
jgi:2-amino-4-hydroxy-6-hydroxymethyldihydropteridine diphosphokinase